MKWGEHKNAWMMDMDGFCARTVATWCYLNLYNLFDFAEGDLPYVAQFVAQILVKTESLLICLPQLRKPGK